MVRAVESTFALNQRINQATNDAIRRIAQVEKRTIRSVLEVAIAEYYEQRQASWDQEMMVAAE